jgi:hypothetical protein
MVEERCEYCWHPKGDHNPGCPIATPELMSEWGAGWKVGFYDSPVSYLHRERSQAWGLGYRVGYNEVETIIGNIMDHR